MNKALIIAPCHSVLTNTLKSLGYQCIFKEKFSYQEILSEIKNYDGLVTSSHLTIDKPLIDAAENLKWIGRLGSGMEIINRQYAQEKSIGCFSTPDGNANAVAEQAMGMLLALSHNIYKASDEIKNSQWIRTGNRGHEIKGQTAGIIGLGNNGYRFANKLMVMGVKVLAYDTNENNYDLPGIVPCQNLDEIYEEANILSFHVPLNKETHYYFNEEMLRKMKKNFILLNLSRGPVVRQETLFKGMKSGKIIGAALDVWEKEPFWTTDNNHLQQQSRQLMDMPNFIGTPHIGGYTHEAFYKMSAILSKKLAGFITDN